MGSCVSVREDPQSASFRLAMSTAAREVLAPLAAVGGASSSGDGLPAGGFDAKSMPEEAGLGFWGPCFDTNDETFFDSQQWLESDCEDDFFSVNGDFTPSCGSTPNYQTVTPIKLQLCEAALTLNGFSEAKSEPSPRKTLAELLQETMPGEPARNEQNTVNGKIQVNEKSESNKMTMDQLPNSLDGTPYLFATNSISGERTPDGDFRDVKEKKRKAKQCCLPSLVHSLSFNEKKRTASPRHYTGGLGTS